MAGSCNHGDEPSGFIKAGNIFWLVEHSRSFSSRTEVQGGSVKSCEDQN